nr:MAG TPA: Redirecting phage packaging protein C packaging protein, DNA Binding.0A [Bacteriophage sp.]
MDYNKLDMNVFIEKLLEHVEMCPCLLIGKYVTEFKKVYKDTIERVYTLDDVRNLIDSYDGISNVNSKFLVLDGIGFLSHVGQNSLLKFIEESKLPIIILSYGDKISPIIMSRMKIIVKRWDVVKNLNFSSVADTIAYINEKNSTREDKMSEFDEVQIMANMCPSLYSIKQQAGDKYGYTNSRLINLMVGTKNR